MLTSGFLDRSVRVVPASPPIVVAANTSTDILPDLTIATGAPIIQYVSRYMQNVGLNPAFYAIGQDCTAAAYHGQIAAGQQFNATDSGPQRVSVFSPLGTTFAITMNRRNDIANDNNIFPSQV